MVRRCLRGGKELSIEPGADESDPNTGADMLQVVQDETAEMLASIQL